MDTRPAIGTRVRTNSKFCHSSSPYHGIEGTVVLDDKSGWRPIKLKLDKPIPTYGDTILWVHPREVDEVRFQKPLYHGLPRSLLTPGFLTDFGDIVRQEYAKATPDPRKFNTHDKVVFIGFSSEPAKKRKHREDQTNYGVVVSNQDRKMVEVRFAAFHSTLTFHEDHLEKVFEKVEHPQPIKKFVVGQRRDVGELWSLMDQQFDTKAKAEMFVRQYAVARHRNNLPTRQYQVFSISKA